MMMLLMRDDIYMATNTIQPLCGWQTDVIQFPCGRHTVQRKVLL